MLKSTEQSNALREITLLRRVRAEAGYSTLVMRGQSNQTIFIWRLETAKPICLSSIDARAITANYFGRHQNLKAPEQARERAYAATKLTRFGSYDSQGLWKGYSQFGNRFLFTGREWSELGSRDIDGRAERPRERARTSQWLTDLRLYDFRNRMYQPELGRFLQPDPKEFAAGDYNLYRYCHNDPVNRSDPTGDDWLEYTGQLITWYPGSLGDRRNPLFSVSATSGMIGQQDSSSTTRPGDPIPAGDYTINTALNPNRQAEALPNGSNFYSAKGIQKASTEDSDWG